MKLLTKFSIGIIIILLIISAGCIGKTITASQGSSTTPSIAPALTTQPVHNSVSQTPPMETLAPEVMVYIVAEKDPVYHKIRLVFNGGPGQNVVQTINCILTRADGQVITATLKPEMNADTILQGTEGTDHIQVTVIYMSGQQFVVMDRDLQKQRHL